MLKLSKFFRAHILGLSKSELWYWAPIEASVVILLTMLTSLWLMPNDPLFISQGFPWFLVPTLFIALRYGSLYGIICAVIPLIYFKSSLNFNQWANQLSGVLLIVMVAGEFSRVWFKDKSRATEESSYLHFRLDHLSKAFFLTKLSHQQLAQSIIVKPVTLREIIESIRKLTIEDKGSFEGKAINQLLLLLSQYCGLISASIFVLDKNNKIKKDAIAHIGKPFVLNLDDALLQNINSVTTARYRTLNDITKKDNSEYLVISPITSSSENVLGYLVVKDAIFTMLNENTMQTMLVILLYFANSIEFYNYNPSLLNSYPDCPSEFARDLAQTSRMYNELDIVSYLISIHFSDEIFSEIIKLKVTEIHRSLDHGWWHYDGQFNVYINLMPFSNSASVSGYLRRMENFLKSNFQISFDGKLVFYRNKKVETSSTTSLIDNLICD